MTLSKPLYVLAFLTLSSTAIAQAAGERDTLIQKQMDCADAHLQQGSALSWNDVCDVPESYSQQHMQIVNQQMDQLEGNVKLQNIIVNPPTLPKKPLWSYEISPETSSIKYVEHVAGSTFVKEKGYMDGISGAFIYHPPAGDALNTKYSDVYRLEGMFTYGKVNYFGGYQNTNGSTTPETFDGISDYMVEVRTLVGKEFYFNDRSTLLTPYFGGGYRSLFDAFSANKAGGYNRRIQYLYLPIGMQLMNKIGNGWAIGGDLEYDIFIRGFVTSYLGELGYGDLQNTQNGGYGLRGSIKIIKNCGRFNIFAEPYVRFWDIHKSRTDQSTPFSQNGHEYVIIGDEPDNTSLEIGAKMGFQF